MTAAQSPILVLDVAHPPRRPDEVEDQLLDGWSQVRNSSSYRILKIIHGYGKSGTGGGTKQVVRNWAFQNRGRMKSVINGEEYSLYDATTQEMRKLVGEYSDPDLGALNPGITIVWVK